MNSVMHPAYEARYKSPPHELIEVRGNRIPLRVRTAIRERGKRENAIAELSPENRLSEMNLAKSAVSPAGKKRNDFSRDHSGLPSLSVPLHPGGSPQITARDKCSRPVRPARLFISAGTGRAASSYVALHDCVTIK
jgi:hypothetical protein